MTAWGWAVLGTFALVIVRLLYMLADWRERVACRDARIDGFYQRLEDEQNWRIAAEGRRTDAEIRAEESEAVAERFRLAWRASLLLSHPLRISTDAVLTPAPHPGASPATTPEDDR